MSSLAAQVMVAGERIAAWWTMTRLGQQAEKAHALVKQSGFYDLSILTRGLLIVAIVFWTAKIAWVRYSLTFARRRPVGSNPCSPVYMSRSSSI